MERAKLTAEQKMAAFLERSKKLKQRNEQQISPELASQLVVHSSDVIWLDNKVIQSPSKIGLLVDIPSRTMEFFFQVIPGGGYSDLQRHIHESVHYVLEGEGYSEIGDQVVRWAQGDFVYTPPWIWHRHYNDGEKEVKMLLSENSRVLDALDANQRESLGMISFKEGFPENI